MGNTERNRRWRRIRQQNAWEKSVNQWQDQMLREVGWYYHYDEPCPPFRADAHTHGLCERFDHPNLQIVFPLGMDRVREFFWNAFNTYIKQGPGVPVNQLVDNIANVPLLTRWAIEGGREVVRLIVPDPQMRYDEASMDAGYAIQHYGASEARQIITEL